MSTVAVSRNAVAAKKKDKTWVENLKKYLIQCGAAYAANSAVTTGNVRLAVQMMHDAKNYNA